MRLFKVSLNKILNLFLLVPISLLLMGSINVYAANIKVMTYNANLLPNIPLTPLTQNLNEPYERARLIPYEIKQHNPDVVVFQEDIAPIMYLILDKNMRKVGYKYKTEVVGSWDVDNLNLLSGGVIIYSRYPFNESPQYLILPKSYGWEGIANKGAVFAQVKKRKKLYNIISVHMQSVQVGSSDEEAQVLSWKVQIGALNQWIANLNLSADIPLILAGDLNANSGEAIAGEMPVPSIDFPLYQYMLMALNANYAAPFASSTLPYSFDGLTDSMNDSIKRETLDHVLCISGYVCADQSQSTINIVALKSDMLESPDLSDHYAVIGDLTYE
ncbi:sphingomyelin phosphodiesterase [Thiotrichales bacterium 19S9-12]|nr:sphingomyelin phosphodiesterase [Thiotrichales bacterium 19S9-11]MCF6811412.1 sphingomyelin phosphodiesterase [Thiotrichales bacterium 19S9-12]